MWLEGSPSLPLSSSPSEFFFFFWFLSFNYLTIISPYLSLTDESRDGSLRYECQGPWPRRERLGLVFLDPWRNEHVHCPMPGARETIEYYIIGCFGTTLDCILGRLGFEV